MIRLLFAQNIGTGFALPHRIVSDKVLKSFGFNPLPMSRI